MNGLNAAGPDPRATAFSDALLGDLQDRAAMLGAEGNDGFCRS
jgi:hypothetical protein